MVQLQDCVYGPTGFYSSMFTGIFYAGSDDTFDHVAVRHGRRTVKMFKIKRGVLSLGKRMDLESRPRNWVDITGLFPFPP